MVRSDDVEVDPSIYFSIYLFLNLKIWSIHEERVMGLASSLQLLIFIPLHEIFLERIRNALVLLFCVRSVVTGNDDVTLLC